jgi:hypothetical protein
MRIQPDPDPKHCREYLNYTAGGVSNITKMVQRVSGIRNLVQKVPLLGIYQVLYGWFREYRALCS